VYSLLSIQLAVVFAFTLITLLVPSKFIIIFVTFNRYS